MTRKTHPPRRFETRSGIPLKASYGPGDVPPGFAAEPSGEYPFTRGIHPGMYRGRLWTMRQYSGFGTAEETNERYRFLLGEGNTGLSVALDLPTQLGLDSDDARAAGEVGKVGVAIDTLEDMEALFQGIPLDRVSTSFTINATAAILYAMYIAAARKQGVPPDRLTGTIQNDILKEYVSRGTWIFPPEPSLRLIVDTIEYGARHTPRFNTLSAAGAHFRDAGATAVQEGGFTLADAAVYVERCIRRGLAVDDFAPRISFYFYTHSDFFEEVAKYRAMRRLWARMLRERFGAKNPRSWLFRFGTVCGGSTLTAQEPENNIARVAFEALSAVLGGAQTIFTCAFDEALALPTEESALLALRTQQIIAHESGVTGTADPLGGSYFLESLTARMEEDMEKLIASVEARGGMVACIEQGIIQRRIAESAYRFQREVEAGERAIVGVNKYAGAPSKPLPLFAVGPALGRRQAERLGRVKAGRDAARADACLARLREAARGSGNLMEPILEAVEAYATLGEMTGVLRGVFGEFREPVSF
ncbi:MAG: methylmalonyl-CoA mutase [Candidatus Tectomicrobia bacterium]|nr:methylmalonyl-CoA mutase [Candidatus Tectomicrobia bacterium]